MILQRYREIDNRDELKGIINGKNTDNNLGIYYWIDKKNVFFTCTCGHHKTFQNLSYNYRLPTTECENCKTDFIIDFEAENDLNTIYPISYTIEDNSTNDEFIYIITGISKEVISPLEVEIYDDYSKLELKINKTTLEIEFNDLNSYKMEIDDFDFKNEGYEIEDSVIRDMFLTIFDYFKIPHKELDDSLSLTIIYLYIYAYYPCFREKKILELIYTHYYRDFNSNRINNDKVFSLLDDLKLKIGVENDKLPQSFIDYLESIDDVTEINLEEMIVDIQFNENVKENNLEKYFDYFKEIKGIIPNNSQKKSMLGYAKEVPFLRVVKCIFQCISNENETIDNVLSAIRNISYYGSVNWNKSFKMKYLHQYKFKQNCDKDINQDIFRKLELKPTLDTFFKCFQ